MGYIPPPPPPDLSLMDPGVECGRGPVGRRRFQSEREVRVPPCAACGGTGRVKGFNGQEHDCALCVLVKGEHQ